MSLLCQKQTRGGGWLAHEVARGRELTQLNRDLLAAPLNSNGGFEAWLETGRQWLVRRMRTALSSQIKMERDR